MRFPPLPTTHIYIDGEVLPYNGQPVEKETLYTKDHGVSWQTAEEAGIPILPPIKLPTQAQIIAAKAAITVKPKLEEWEREALRCVKEIEDHFLEIEAAKAIKLSEEDAKPAPFLSEMEGSVYCEWNETQYRWNFRHHKGAKRYQKITTYSLFEYVPVDSPDFSSKISFDHLNKELLHEEELQRTGWRHTGTYYRQTYSMLIEYRGENYEVVLVVQDGS